MAFASSYPGKAKANEPLAVEFAGGLLKQRDAAAIVFNEVVVGGEDISDALLS